MGDRYEYQSGALIERIGWNHYWYAKRFFSLFSEENFTLGSPKSSYSLIKSRELSSDSRGFIVPIRSPFEADYMAPGFNDQGAVGSLQSSRVGKGGIGKSFGPNHELYFNRTSAGDYQLDAPIVPRRSDFSSNVFSSSSLFRSLFTSCWFIFLPCIFFSRIGFFDSMNSSAAFKN